MQKPRQPGAVTSDQIGILVILLAKEPRKSRGGARPPVKAGGRIHLLSTGPACELNRELSKNLQESVDRRILSDFLAQIPCPDGY
jgi:hypothetical protein